MITDFLRSIFIRRVFNASQKSNPRIIEVNKQSEGSIRNFLLFCTNKSISEVAFVAKTLKQKGFEVDILLAQKNDHIPPEFQAISTHLITNKDNNWLGFPKEESVKSVLTKKYDMLIGFHLTDNYQLQYLTAKVSAMFKVGKYNDSRIANLFDFMVDLEDNASEGMFISEINRFFRLYS